jgi:excisionase family DNA binding protein
LTTIQKPVIILVEITTHLKGDVMAEKEYLTYEEAMAYIGCGRSTLYTLITEQDITTHKFKYDKKRYLALADVKRLKEMKEKPWTAGEKRPSEGSDMNPAA